MNSGHGSRHPGDFSRLLIASALVAVLDISFAATWWVIYRGATTFPRLLKSIASGLLGKAALQGGTGVVVLGAIAHCTVALGWSAIFLLASRNWPAFSRALSSPGGALKVGMPYGVMVWLAMNFVVIPLSRATPTAPGSTWFWVCLAWHAVGVGLPMAVVLRERSS